MALIAGHSLVAGGAQGRALVLEQPISFWGGVDPGTARITLSGHPQCGQSISGQVLVIPRLIGSSSSSSVMLELLHAGRAPAAVLLGERDAILCLGAIVAREMEWPSIPIVEVDISGIRSGDSIDVRVDGMVKVDSHDR